MQRFTAIFVLLMLFSPLTTKAQEGLRIIEWNTENFFDCNDNPLKDDDAFLPTSPRRWTLTRYRQKITNVTKAIMAMSKAGRPNIICLTEVENDTVMRDLTQRSPLIKMGYKYIVTDSPDERGINVAFVYQPTAFKVLESRVLRMDFGAAKKTRTRDILYVRGQTYTLDTLHFFVCHFSSKISGRKASERLRCKEAERVVHFIDSLQIPKAKIIILGDFNERSSEPALSTIFKTEKADGEIIPNHFYDLTLDYKDKEVAGSYKYCGRWEMLDHIIVSGTLLHKGSGLYTAPTLFQIASFPFLLIRDEHYSGLQPFRNYNGYRYQHGFSDHLPLFIDLIVP